MIGLGLCRRAFQIRGNMIIDCHTHIGRNEHIKSSVDDLLRSMDKAGIDKSLVFAGDMNDAPNKWVLEQVKPHRDRLLMVAAVHPHKFGPTQMEKDAERTATMYQDGDIVAVKFYTGYDHYYPSSSEARCYLEHLEDVGCPAIFHMGDCLNSVKHAKLKYAHPLGIDEVAVDYPNMNFIIAHMGFPWVRDAAEVCYKNANVYSDISGFVYGKFSFMDQLKFKKTLIEFMDIASSKKLLFGTDFPISDQSSYLSTLDQDFFGEILKSQDLTENVIKAFKL